MILSQASSRRPSRSLCCPPLDVPLASGGSSGLGREVNPSPGEVGRSSDPAEPTIVQGEDLACPECLDTKFISIPCPTCEDERESSGQERDEGFMIAWIRVLEDA